LSARNLLRNLLALAGLAASESRRAEVSSFERSRLRRLPLVLVSAAVGNDERGAKRSARR
jgi:hypothetical protein